VTSLHTSVFVSHSSADRQAAQRVAERLRSEGCATYFLDFDPDQGIKAARRWEDELYQQLRASRALLLLWSEGAAASRWVFAEVAIAKALGKQVIVARVDGTPLVDIIAPIQAVDLTSGDDNFTAVLQALDEASAWSGADAFTWDPKRPPYPGLRPMEADDAGVYFGRDDEIDQLEERLRSLRRVGAGKLLVIVGASGSGKSSLIRAGLLPRLDRQDDWLVVPAFRPRPSAGGQPLDELATALATRVGDRRPERTSEIRDRLRSAPQAADVLRGIAGELRASLNKPDVSLLLAVDQLDEALMADGDAEASDAFLRWIAAVLREPRLANVIATLRSDYLPDFQRHPAVREMAVELFTLPPLHAASWSEIVESPAARAGVMVERALTDTLVRDVGSDESLPFLASMLERLWRKRGAAMTLESYERAGGLDNAIAAAAEDVWGAVALTADVEEAARQTLTSLVGIGSGNRFVRRSIRWDDIPAAARPIVQRFEDERLVVSRDSGGTRELELAHDALIRSWARLAGWLDTDRDFLEWRLRLSQRALQRKEGDVLRGAALLEAQRWIDDPRAAILTAGERTLVNDSVTEHRRNVARVLVAASEYRRAGRVRDLGAAAALAVDALQTHPSPDAVWQVRSTARLLPRHVAASKHDAVVTAVACSPDGLSFASGDESGRVQIVAAGNGRPLMLEGHHGSVERIRFGPGGLLVTACADRTARIWRPDGPATPLLHDAPVVDVQIDPTGTRLLTVAGMSGLGRYAIGPATLHTWDLATGTPLARVEHDAYVGARWSPDGQTIFSGAHGGALHAWNADNGETRGEIGGEEMLVAFDVRFSDEGPRILMRRADGRNGTVFLLAPSENALVQENYWPSGPIGPVRFGARGWVAFSSDDSMYCFDVRTGCQTHRFVHESITDLVVVSPNDRYIATAEFDGVFRVWSLDTGAEVARIASDYARDLAFSDDGRTLVTSGPGAEAHVWDIAYPFDPIVEWNAGAGARARFDGTGTLLVACGTPFRSGEDLTAPKQTLAMVFDAASGANLGGTYSTGVAHALDVSPGGEVVVVASAGRALVFDPRSNADPIALPYENTVSAAILDSHAVVASFEGQVDLWDWHSHEAGPSVRHPGVIHALAVAPSGGRFAVGGDGSGVSIFEKPFASAIRLDPRGVLPPDDGRIRIPSAQLGFDPAGRLLAVLDLDRQLWLWDVDRRECLSRQPIADTMWLSSMAFSADGGLLAMAMRGAEVNHRIPGRVRVVDTRSNAVVFEREDEDAAGCVVFHPRDPVLVSGHTNGYVLLVNCRTGEIEQQLRRGKAVTALTFSPDGSRLATTSADGMVRVKLVGHAELLAEAERRLIRPIAPEERVKIVPELLSI
jgi:WD40 repeat protein